MLLHRNSSRSIAIFLLIFRLLQYYGTRTRFVNEDAEFESYSSLCFFFFPLFELLFSVNIYLNNCYLIKCNKQKEKYQVSREKIVHCVLNIFVDKQSEFQSFPTIYCGKTGVTT